MTPELTHALIRTIRGWGEPGEGPDLVLTNRPNDYHRDHRYTAQAVLDASYVLTVPTLCPEVPHLRRMPIFAYWSDRFREGGAFRPDVVIPIDAALEIKASIGLQHESQIFEWLPYNAGRLDEVPAGAADRRRYVLERLRARGAAVLARPGTREALGPAAATTTAAEAFQISEYGRQPSEAELRALFPL